MTVEIPREFQDFVNELVKSGRYTSPLDVVTAALILLDHKEPVDEYREGSIKAVYPDIAEMVEESLAQARAGQLSDGEEFFKQLEREEAEREASEGRKTA